MVESREKNIFGEKGNSVLVFNRFIHEDKPIKDCENMYIYCQSDCNHDPPPYTVPHKLSDVMNQRTLPRLFLFTLSYDTTLIGLLLRGASWLDFVEKLVFGERACPVRYISFD